MRAFKLTDKNMQCRGYQYELGVLHKIEGEIIPHNNGFHSTRTIAESFGYVPIKNSRVFEVELSGTIKESGDILISSEIKFIREYSHTELADMIMNDHEYFADIKGECIIENGYFGGEPEIYKAKVSTPHTFYSLMAILPGIDDDEKFVQFLKWIMSISDISPRKGYVHMWLSHVVQSSRRPLLDKHLLNITENENQENDTVSV